MAEEEVVAAAAAEAKAEAVSPVQSIPKTKLEENFNPQEEPVIVPQEIVVIPAEPVVVPLSAEAVVVPLSAEAVSTVQSDHKRKLDENLSLQNEVAAEPIVVPSAEAPVDWNEISIEVQNSIPDAKRPRLDEDFDRSNNLLSLENVEQLSKGNLEIGNPCQPYVENNQTTDGEYSSVGEDSSVGDLSSAQQQPLSENQTEIEVLNIEDGRCELQQQPDLEVTSSLNDDEMCSPVLERRSISVRDHHGYEPQPSTWVSSTTASFIEIGELYALIDSQQADIRSMRAELQELKERMTRVEDFVFGQNRGNESDSGLSSSTSCLD